MKFLFTANFIVFVQLSGSLSVRLEKLLKIEKKLL